MFENKAITGKGLFLLNALKIHEGSRIRFEKAVGHIDALTKAQLHKPNIDWAFVEHNAAYNQGTLFKVSPTKIDSTSDSRVVIRFDDNHGQGRGIRSVFLFASLVDAEENVIEGLDHVLFAVASTEHEMRIKNDDHNGMFVTFQLLLSNGYSRIASVEHGVATMQDLEDMSQNAQEGGVATIMFNAATSDLQLFDRNGNLIDQANLPTGIYNNGEPVTVHNKQFVYDEKIWVDPNAIYENANTIYGYKTNAGDSDYAGFGLKVGNAVDWFEEMDELGADAMKAAITGFKADVLVSMDNNGGISVTAPGPNHIAEMFKASDKLSQPSVADFFDISVDRDKATPEDIGDDKVIIISDCAGNNEKLIRLIQGYAQLALDDAELLDAAYSAFVDAKLPALVEVASASENDADLAWIKQHFGKYSEGIKNAATAEDVLAAFDALKGAQSGRNIAREILEVYPNEMFEIPEGAGLKALGIPSLAVDPADIQNKYTKSRCDELKVKYAELGTEENGLANATISTLGDVLSGILEGQVERARKAFLAADSAWHAVGGAYTDLHSVALRSDGIILNQDSQQYKISLSEETDEDGKQKIALSTIEEGQVKPFAFIGDSGMLGGAPLFSVRIAAHAWYIDGGCDCEWLLNSMSVSDGYEAHLKGIINNGIVDEDDIVEPDSEIANHLVVLTKPNLSVRDFTHVAIEVSGITGSNQLPSTQFKHLNCIVPLGTIIDGQKQRQKCSIDLTEPLYSWVQTDVDILENEKQLPPDMIIVRAWGMKIDKTVKPGQHPIGEASNPDDVTAGLGAMSSNASSAGNVTNIAGDGIDAVVNSDETYPGMPVYRDLLHDDSLDSREVLAYGTTVKILSLNDVDNMALLHVVNDPADSSHNGQLFILASKDHWEHLRLGSSDMSDDVPSLAEEQGHTQVDVEPLTRGKVCSARVKLPARGLKYVTENNVRKLVEDKIVEVMPGELILIDKRFTDENGTRSIIGYVGQDRTQVLMKFDPQMLACLEKTALTDDYEIIKDEASWNASYANGCLAKYYQWADSIQPYKEDLWNTVEHRAAGWADWHTAGGEKKDANGNYIYPNCVRCFAGALNAAEAAFPWIAPNFAGDEKHAIRIDYAGSLGEGGKSVIFPWKSKQVNWGCESLPKALNDTSLKISGTVDNQTHAVTIPEEGKGTFDASNIFVNIIDLTQRTVNNDEAKFWEVYSVMYGSGEPAQGAPTNPPLIPGF